MSPAWTTASGTLATCGARARSARIPSDPRTASRSPRAMSRAARSPSPATSPATSPSTPLPSSASSSRSARYEGREYWLGPSVSHHRLCVSFLLVQGSSNIMNFFKKQTKKSNLKIVFYEVNLIAPSSKFKPGLFCKLGLFWAKMDNPWPCPRPCQGLLGCLRLMPYCSYWWGDLLWPILIQNITEL